jgi:hypothetical protein
MFPVVLLLVSCAPFFVALVVGMNAQAEPKNMIYQAMWQSDNVRGELYVNGFLIDVLNGPQSFGAAPLNPLLIGKNEIWATVRKADTSEPAYLSFGVSKLPQGDVAATNERGNVVSMELKDDNFKGAEITTMGEKFESALDFSKNLSGTGDVSEKDVIEYAKKIYDLFKAKDAQGIQKEFKVKISDYAKAYSSDSIAAEFASYLTEDLLRGKLAKINPQNLQAKKSGPNNKLWQVFEGDEELIRITSADGSQGTLGMYIGIVDGKLQVVR